MSDRIDYDRIHALAVELSRLTQEGNYRDSAAPAGDIAKLIDSLYAKRPDTMSQDLGILPSGGIERIFPVMHRAYDLYIGSMLSVFVDTREIDALETITNTTVVKDSWFKRRKVVTTQTRKRVVQTLIADNRHRERNYPDAGCIIDLRCPSLDSWLYTVIRLRPEWKRSNPYYEKRTVAERKDGEVVEPDACIDIHSKYFKIDCLPPKDFVRVLMLPDDQKELRRATLQHLLSLPEILGPYLDKKEAMIR